MIDIAANLTSSQFRADVPDVIERACAAGVQALLIPGITLEAIDDAIILASQHQAVYAMVGVHPHHATSVNQAMCAALAERITNNKVIAWGEIGLDCHRHFVPLATQIAALEMQLEIATSHPTHAHLPLLFHERDAHLPFRDTLAPFLDALSGFVVHCFTGNKTALRYYLDQGGYIGVTGWLCDPGRGTTLRNIVRYIPLDRLLIETDCPYLLPKDIQPMPRNRRNEPHFLPHVARRIADCMNVSYTDVLVHSTANACRLFYLPQ